MQLGESEAQSNLQGSDSFRKAKRSKGRFVTDGVRPSNLSLYIITVTFFRVLSHLIGGYTIVLNLTKFHTGNLFLYGSRKKGN